MSRAEPVTGELRWLAGILSGEEQDPGLGPMVAPGATEGLVVVPGAARPRLVLPARRRVAAAALRNHAGLRSPSVRAARVGLATAFATGIPQRVFRDRLVFPTGEPPLVGHLREVLGQQGMEVAVVLGPPAPNRKPVLQLLSPSGAPIGFAKVGWNPFTVPLVRNEAMMLEGLAGAPMRSLETPRAMHHGRWGGLELLVTSPLPRDARRYGESSPALAALSEVATERGTTSQTLAASAYWRELRAERASGARVAADLGGSFEAIEDRYGALELRFGDWHGDWTPWNLARAGGRLWAIDWEHARRGVPVGLDAVHFRFQVEFLRRNHPLPVAAERAAGSARADLERLAVTGEARRLLTILHLVEIWLRAEDARRLGAGVNPRVYPVIADEIRRRAGALAP